MLSTSLDGVTAWKRPDPTKWAVVVIFCARTTNRQNEVVFSAKSALSIPCAIFDHDGPLCRLGAFLGCQPIYRARAPRSRCPIRH